MSETKFRIKVVICSHRIFQGAIIFRQSQLTIHSSFPDPQQARENMEQKYTKKNGKSGQEKNMDKFKVNKLATENAGVILLPLSRRKRVFYIEAVAQVLDRKIQSTKFSYF